MSPADRILEMAILEPEKEQFILLGALSVFWLTPGSDQSRRTLQRYHERDFAADALRETALQLFLLAGFQTSIEAAFQIREVFGQGLSSCQSELDLISPKEWRSRGLELQSKVYEENVERLRSNLNQLSPELELWTVLIGYGMVMSRPGLPRHWRELLEIAVLAAQGFPRQLHSHFRGAMHLGASLDEVGLALRIAEISAGSDKLKPAWHMWRRISGQSLP